jgi:hypothetical protein
VTGRRKKESLRGWLAAGVWLLLVIACPTTLMLLGIANASFDRGPQTYDRRPPVDARLFVAIAILVWGQVAVSVLAAVAAYLRTRDWHLRLMAWMVAGAVLLLTWWAALAASIAVTGQNL